MTKEQYEELKRAYIERMISGLYPYSTYQAKMRELEWRYTHDGQIWERH